MPRSPITVEHLWALPRVGAPVPSAVGECCVVPVTTHSMETNEATTRLWLVSIGGRAPRPLTPPHISSSQPALSPDGRSLAFVRKPSSRPEQGQLHVMPLDGGEAERLTDLPLGVADPLWFPDGKRIAFLAPVFACAPTIEETCELVKSREKDPVKAAVTEDRFYRYWDRWLTDGKVHHVFALDLETRKMMDLTPDSTGWFPLMDPADSFRIAPDGREIAFGASRSLPPHDPVVFGIFTVEVPERIGSGERAGRMRSITEDHPADCERPIYSPDGRLIIYGMQRELDFYADRVRLVAHERVSGERTVVTESWDRSAAGWAFGRSSSVLYLRAENDGGSALFALDLERALREPERHSPSPLRKTAARRGSSEQREAGSAPAASRGRSGAGGWFGDPRPAGERLFATHESLSQPPEVFSCRLDGTDPRPLTEFTRPVLSEVELGAVEEMTFEGAGGKTVQMFLVHPPGEAGRDGPRRPLVHVIHGGPHGVSGDQWHWRWNSQVFAAPGYRVALVNFHGSTGWGQDFAASILGRWGDQPYQDIMTATDLLIARGLADPNRMAAAGGSYGGYLASWIASQTDRFACIVNHAGCCDFQTQYASDITQGRRRSMGGEPWDDLEGMDRYNPMRHARGFRSPMLVIHGEKDYRVPYDQALEIYNVYKAMGLPARLVCYPDENHWILKPRNSRHWYGEVLGWFERWLGGD